LIGNAELEALELEDEEEPSYLADLNKAPDFIDEAPVEAPEVCTESHLLTNHGVLTASTSAVNPDDPRGHQDDVVI
jgi:hypothetical protein